MDIYQYELIKASLNSGMYESIGQVLDIVGLPISNQLFAKILF